jgi:tetratricopeptide (TPR) repeat protein
VGAILAKLGQVLLDQGDLTSARAVLERALEIFEATLGADSPEVGATLSNLGRVLDTQGDLAGARAALERALAITQALWARTTQRWGPPCAILVSCWQNRET